MKKVTAFVILLAILGIVGVILLSYFKVLPAPSINLEVLNTPTVTVVSGPVILEAIQNQSKLETISMEVANDQDVTRVWGLQGACRESVTYLGYYRITAGVDLQNIKAADINVANGADPRQGSITITLPPASIMHVELDTQHSRVVHEEQSIISQLCGTQLPEMVTQAQQETQQMASDTALEENILQVAQDRASFELQKLFLSFGFSNATILFK